MQDEDSGEAARKERREAFIDPIDFEGDELEDFAAAAAADEGKVDDFFAELPHLAALPAIEADLEDEEERRLEEH